MSDLLIHLEEIKKNYIMGRQELQVLKGISLDILRNEYVALMGPSGSGKSTLLNMIGGIDQPSSGIISFQGQDLTSLSEKELTRFRRDKVGFVFQFYNLIPTLTALENVAVATEIAEAPISAAEALDLVGLKDRLDHFPSQLSGGQQQRVAIARALAKRPKLMLCDEPTGALDRETTEMVLELLQRINKKTGTSMVMITHSQTMAQMADRSAVISDGKIIDISVGVEFEGSETQAKGVTNMFDLILKK